MSDLLIHATTRSVHGRHVKALRRQGSVPAVVYGHSVAARSVSADARALERIWQRAGRTHLVDLVVDDGKAQKVLIREVQIDPRSRRALHADLFVVNLLEKLTADIHVALHGSAPAVDDLKIGQIVQAVTTLKVECLPQDLPAQLSVDISGLSEIGAHVTIGDIELPKGVVLIHADPAEVVVTIGALRVQEAEEEDAEAPVAEAEPAATTEDSE